MKSRSKPNELAAFTLVDCGAKPQTHIVERLTFLWWRQLHMERATQIPVDDGNISITCAVDGTWLHFTASNGMHAAINVDLLDGGRVIGGALARWCEDRQKQAAQIRAASGGG